MVILNNRMALNYGSYGISDVATKSEGVPVKATEHSKVNTVAETSINDRLRRQADDLTRISTGNQNRIYNVQNANNANGVIVDMRLRIDQLSVAASTATKISDRESIRSEISSIKSSLSNLLISSGEMIRMQANQTNEDVLALLTL